MEQNGDITKIAEKIKKLLALANNNTNENEASLAMEKVQEILSTYNLTMAQVESTVNGNGKKDEGRVKTKIEKSAMYDYQIHLMHTIADTHFCLYFLGRYTYQNPKTLKYSTRKRHVLVGKEANVLASQMLFDYLNSTIDKLVNGIYPPPTNLCKSAVSWREGCSQRLQERLREKKAEADRKQEEQARQTPHNGMALILLSDVRKSERNLNYDFYYGDAPGTYEAQMAKLNAEIATKPPAPVKPETEQERARRERKWKRYQESERRKWLNKDINAYYAGKKKGDTIGLDIQINGQDSVKMVK